MSACDYWFVLELEGCKIVLNGFGKTVGLWKSCGDMPLAFEEEIAYNIDFIRKKYVKKVDLLTNFK